MDLEFIIETNQQEMHYPPNYADASEESETIWGAALHEC
jgi:hypothetical protein